MNKHQRREPCGNCPFRKDAPLAYWHPSQYQMLADIERTEGDPDVRRIFACHKDRTKPPEEREYCVGWLINQRDNGIPNLALRMALMFGPNTEALGKQLDESHPPEGVDLYASVTELVRLNIDRDQELNPHRYRTEDEQDTNR